MKQPWFCEACCAYGAVTIARHEQAWGGVQAVTDDHRDKSVICAGINGAKKVRVKLPECSSKEWQAIRIAARNARGVPESPLPRESRGEDTKVKGLWHTHIQSSRSGATSLRGSLPSAPRRSSRSLVDGRLVCSRIRLGDWQRR